MKNILFVLFFIPSLLVGNQDFIYLTNPKSGTHLLIEILQEITGLKWRHLIDQHDLIEFELEEAKKNHQFLHRHTLTEEEYDFLTSKKYKFVFLYRDPRDQLISQIFWVMKVDPTNPMCKIEALDEKIKALITGQDEIPPFFETWFLPMYEKMSQTQSEDVYKVRFEDLVGFKGSGNDEVQMNNILKIANFLDFPIHQEKIEMIKSRIWGIPGTFRKGTVGDWRNYFNNEHIQMYKEKYGNLLIELGYERDLNW